MLAFFLYIHHLIIYVAFDNVCLSLIANKLWVYMLVFIVVMQRTTKKPRPSSLLTYLSILRRRHLERSSQLTFWA